MKDYYKLIATKNTKLDIVMFRIISCMSEDFLMKLKTRENQDDNKIIASTYIKERNKRTTLYTYADHLFCLP